MRVKLQAAAAFLPKKSPSTHGIEGWVVSRACLHGLEKHLSPMPGFEHPTLPVHSLLIFIELAVLFE
jgi:hypothetical protein